MTDAGGRVERAIRWAPEEDRARYAEEWRHDMAAAAALGRSEDEVARAATRLSVDLRLRWWARVLLGGTGAAKALVAWTGLLALVAAAFVLGGIVVLLLAGVVVVLVVALARSGTPSDWSHWLVVIAISVGVCSGAFVWWAAGAKIDAADSFAAEPPAAAWGGAALLVFLASGVLLVVAAVVAVRRERRAARVRSQS